MACTVCVCTAIWLLRTVDEPTDSQLDHLYVTSSLTRCRSCLNWRFYILLLCHESIMLTAAAESKTSVLP